MAEVQVTVADLFRIIGEKEVTIARLGQERLQLQQELARMAEQVRVLKALEPHGPDGSPQ